MEIFHGNFVGDSKKGLHEQVKNARCDHQLFGRQLKDRMQVPRHLARIVRDDYS